jgi:hypothetical protein
MTAAGLPFYNLNSIVSEDKVEFAMKRHGDGHIGEKCFYIWHLTPANAVLYIVQLL